MGNKKPKNPQDLIDANQDKKLKSVKIPKSVVEDAEGLLGQVKNDKGEFDNNPTLTDTGKLFALVMDLVRNNGEQTETGEDIEKWLKDNTESGETAVKFVKEILGK